MLQEVVPSQHFKQSEWKLTRYGSCFFEDTLATLLRHGLIDCDMPSLS